MAEHPYRGFTGGQRRLHRLVRIAPWLARPRGAHLAYFCWLVVLTLGVHVIGHAVERRWSPAHPHTARTDQQSSHAAAGQAPDLGPCDQVMHQPRGETQCNCYTHDTDGHISSSGTFFRCDTP